MLNSLWNSKLDDSANVLQMLKGHQYFLDRNTGQTDDATQQHYVFNPQYVLSNNRHFIAASMQEAQPNGDATTEGQSLQIIGYCYAFMGTKDKAFLDAAERTFDAYIEYFYGGQPIPNPPAPYICNWLVNGKEPVLANYPVNFDYPTHSGFKGELLTYSAGKTVIPHGAPYFGEYLDKATFAFVGALAWDSIVASVQAINEDGSTNWNEDGIQYDVDWIINWEGKKIDWDGNVEEDADGNPVIYPEGDYGTLQLKDTSVNGDVKTNFSPKVPVAQGGYLMGRNEAWHNRPLNVPVSQEWYGNAADAEEWFADAAYLLWKLTKNEKYWRAWQSVLKTTESYSDIDLYDKFFRQSNSDVTPFTDGISYDYTYPSEGVNIVYGRDSGGFITISSDAASQHTIEQQAIWFRVSKDSKLRVQYGGKANDGTSIGARATLELSNVKNTTDPSLRSYFINLPTSTSDTVNTYDVPLSSLIPETDVNGYAYFMADERSMYTYGNTVALMDYVYGIIDSRQGATCKATFPDLDSGYGVGFWLLDDEKLDVKSIAYKATAAMEIGIVDDNNWRWYWTIPASGSFQSRTLNRSDLRLRSYQPDHSDAEPRPATPVYTLLEEFTVTPTVAGSSFWWYCVNDVPPTYTSADGYTMLFSLRVSGDSAYEARVGDCTILDYKTNNLYCTPGVIPFSNISVPESVQFDGWRGMPYPGYQYPFIFTIEQTAGEYSTRLTNMVEFLWQSQQKYFNNYGQLGPGMSAYIWNRWDNLKYGTADTWTMFHWGDDHAWAGYQPRAFNGAARAWYELVLQGKAIPPKLKEYVENWLQWLYDGFKANGCSPTDWLTDGTPVFDQTDFTGHMSGLWLSGACFAVLAGSTLTFIPDYIEMVVKEIEDNFINTGIGGQIMNGSWSPAVRLNTGNGVENNGMFFGFWSGELMRGLGMYLLYKQMQPKQSMYDHF